MSYGAERYRILPSEPRAIVDKILKGAKPSDLPYRATKEVRVHNQSESGETDRPGDPAECDGASRSSHQIAFWIFDFRFWIESQENELMNAFLVEVAFRQSKIGNPKSKIGGDCRDRSDTRDV